MNLGRRSQALFDTRRRPALFFIPVLAIVFGLPMLVGQTLESATTTAPAVFTIRTQEGMTPTQGEPVSDAATEASSPTMETEKSGSAGASIAAASQPTTLRASKAVGPGKRFDLWVLAPALVAILLAIITQQVVPSLALGILTGAVLMCIFEGHSSPIAMVMYAIDHYLLGVFIPVDKTNLDRLGDGYNRLHVLIFTQFIGGMIAVIEANGGTRAMVSRVIHLMKSRRGGQLGALFGGVVIFFDDYANALILGPAMRPVFDKLRISRAKLAYIVDSTAAPVASLFIGTWLAAEINYLDGALGGLGAHRPEFLAGVTGSSAFWTSIPYRTYAWLALWIIFVLAWTGRDFGPMKKAEREALADPQGHPVDNGPDVRDTSHWILGFLPVATLVLMTVSLLLLTGYQACQASGTSLTFGSLKNIGRSLSVILSAAESYKALLYSGLAALVVAIFSTVTSRRLKLSKTMEAMQSGMQRIFGAQIILILAWGLSDATKDLELGPVATDFLQGLVDSGHFAVPLLPTAIFITACIIAFATGTSWGTMGILCPTTVAIAAGLLAPLPVEQALPLFYASIGAVLTGAVFGDHCSPISDTTVLSAMTSECDLTLHVRTQLPYALVTALVGLLCTDLLDFFLMTHHRSFYFTYWNVYCGTALAAIVLAMIVFVVGRKVRPVVRPQMA